MLGKALDYFWIISYILFPFMVNLFFNMKIGIFKSIL